MMRTQTQLHLKEKEVVEYNRRQITLMENRIKFYRNNQLSIGNFIDDIDALIYWIQNPPHDWIEVLNGIMWEIESIYATALAHEEALTSKELKKISHYVDKIEEQVIWYKQNYLPPEEEEYP